MLLQLLFLWERDAVDSLERFSVAVAQPVCLGVLHNFERLRILRRRNMRASAQVYKVTDPVNRSEIRVANFLLN